VQASIVVRAAARAAYARAESARRRALHFRDVLLPERQRALKETLRYYNGMQIGVFQLLQVQRDTLDAGVDYVATQLEYWRARAALDLVLAGRHTGVELGGAAARGPMPRAASAGADTH
jgi:outer membrane protein TolC